MADSRQHPTGHSVELRSLKYLLRCVLQASDIAVDAAGHTTERVLFIEMRPAIKVPHSIALTHGRCLDFRLLYSDIDSPDHGPSVIIVGSAE